MRAGCKRQLRTGSRSCLRIVLSRVRAGRTYGDMPLCVVCQRVYERGLERERMEVAAVPS